MMNIYKKESEAGYLLKFVPLHFSQLNKIYFCPITSYFSKPVEQTIVRFFHLKTSFHKMFLKFT